MKILFCSPEVYPFSKTGGLADVAVALPKAITELGHTMHVVAPYYNRTKRKFGDQMTFLGEREIVFGDQREIAQYYETKLDGITYFFVGHEFFDRKRFYDHRDDAKRFIFFNLAILEMFPLINFYPNIIHINDWQTSLIPYFLDSDYSNNENYINIKTLLTIHNLEKQGSFPMAVERFFNKKNYTYINLNQINFLKAGIMRASKVNTVSKSYRSEILTKFFGFSLDGALKARQFELYGIQNGLDFNLYNPKTDKFIYYNYDKNDFKNGKLKNKIKLYKDIKFKDENKILISYIGRFARQKGIDLIIESIETLLAEDKIYFTIIGEGDIEYELYFEDLQKKYPNNVYYHNEHNHKISQKFYAATDLLLMPSLYEASGLNQMIAMRYGAIPLVRKTGGLKDTVISYKKENGFGFLFENYDSNEFLDKLNEAISIFENDKKLWDNLIYKAMEFDHSITKMAQSYEKLYKEMIIE